MFRLATWDVKTLFYSQQARSLRRWAREGSFLGRNILGEQLRVGSRSTTRPI